MLKHIMKYAIPPRLYSTTVDKQEMEHFKKYVNMWWNEFGAMKPLHAMNKIRVPWIRESLLISKEIKNPALPLAGCTILDVGCGGGILSEPLAKIGAEVTGLDANVDLINSAKSHAQLFNTKVNYIVSTIEQHAEEACEKYDAVVASEVIEHITNKSSFIEACLKCLKPNGKIFITTPSKTWQSNVFGIIVAEDILGVMPQGTHQYEKFISPTALQRLLEDNNCRTEMIHGLLYNPVGNCWHWCSDTTFLFALNAVKLSKN
ncbi:ubiquinone biosynthesis O-methyltransferase, mitochondrial [Diorhabda carinulata]|uniref:ubiquinone biosynthesis O-methyltransferase, mitochondrial n=1 Tax=Diorhabda carinulata TaxID=1163345 RepID=UPI0025A127B0|nr:ubiquinone biosynthesis O-methyltransferase, mitochondrial [Diorhabda carinulata]XP_057670349.1 ubiquinone biosynthesis O-methyltransferase, mitochondrial [Diorhabda carinulata]